MPWQDRLKEAKYTAPSGEFIIFNYENVSKSFDKKTTAFNFPDADGTYIQDTGHTGDRHPMRLFFWGDDHDLEAEFFITLLKERGQGLLEHPLYGIIDVVPFGTITRRDDLKTAANQTIFEVAFWETIGIVYPVSQNDPGSNVLFAVDEFNIAEAFEFADLTDLDSAVEQSSFLNSYNALLDNVESGLQVIADVQEDVEQQFNAIVDSVNRGIDVLISQPLTLASQTMQLIQAPARALTNISARLDGYKNLADDIFGGDDAIATPGNDSRNANEFHTKNLFAATYVAASIVSVVNNKFVTKTEALEAAEAIINQFNDVVAWRDDNYESLSVPTVTTDVFQSIKQIDTGSAYQRLQEAVAITAGFLVEISFTLKQESIIILDRPRTIVDLVAELYGTVDDELDFFITSNNLSGSEILELPKGREIVYYI